MPIDYEQLLKQKEKGNKSISYMDMLNCYSTAIEDKTDYEGTSKYLVCPEPYTIIKAFDEYENNINRCSMILNQLMKTDVFSCVERKDTIKELFWFNSARNGINVRAGFLNYSRDSLNAIRLDSESKGNVLLLGQAGAGKSELMHNMAFDLLREYSPWEVEEYLVNYQLQDKTIIEDEESKTEKQLSETVNQIKKYVAFCEDYNEVSDLIDLLNFAYMCMNERLRLFSRLGVENCSEFVDKAEKILGNKELQIILPRKVFFIDRFASVMKGASLKETGILNELLQKLLLDGPRSGLHFVLSCREYPSNMSDEFEEFFGYNFIMKSRIAVSQHFLDNEDALQLDEGEVLVKDTEISNVFKYKSPFIDIEKVSSIKLAVDQLVGKCEERFHRFSDEGNEETIEDLIGLIDNQEKSMNDFDNYNLSFEEIGQLTEFVERKNNTLDFEDFQEGFIRVLKQDEADKTGRFKKEINKSVYEGELVICPEPFSFLREYDKLVSADESGDSETQEIYWKIFKEEIENNKDRFKRIDVSDKPEQYQWFNKTDRGINLRPGLLNNNRNNPFAVTMGNEFVHGLVVGRTGAGKSVFLNNLIFNLLMEYAPWELDLFLVDFKKVELSRYMSKGVTPHVNAVAATSEVRYVVSLISYLVNCMNARQNFFSRLGVKDIASFRKKVKKECGVEIVLPRVLLLVDEFQQMFLEATPRESMKIEEMLTAITKLGRATGYHLLFASQEMSSTLSSNVFANFKIRFALLCESEISSTILGNSAASRIKIGEVLLNTESGAEEDNKLYKVPFINDKREDFFYSYLENKRQLCANYGYEKSWKFYEEDRTEKISKLVQINKDIFDKKKNIIEGSKGRYREIMVLGSPVVFNCKKTDWETFFIENGVGKNIIAASPNVDDLVYIQKLLMVNFGYSFKKYQHYYFTFNNIIRNKYKIENDVRFGKMCTISNDVATLRTFNDNYKFKVAILNLIEKVKDDAVLFAKGIDGLPGVSLSEETKAQFFGDDFSVDNIPAICRQIKDKPMLIQILQCYQNYITKGVDNIFPPSIIWISGCENCDGVIREETLKGAARVNMYFIFFATSSDDIDRDVVRASDYYFVGGSVEAFYNKFDVAYTRKDMNPIVIDFKIRSMDTTRSFKKFSVDFEDSVAPAIDFDNE